MTSGKGDGEFSPNDVHLFNAAVKAKRERDRKVPPVYFEGIRYQEVYLGQAGEPGQQSGFLGAYRGDSHEQLWLINVYAVEILGHLERDVQEVYFINMELLPEQRQLLIENDLHQQFTVDIHDRSISRLK